MNYYSYKPTFKSFLGNTVYSGSILLTAAAITIFCYNANPKLVIILDIIAVLIFLSSMVPNVLLHLTSLYLDDRYIETSGPILTVRIYWDDIIGQVVLRERNNIMSRMDRMITVRSNFHLLSYNISIEIKKDKPSI